MFYNIGLKMIDPEYDSEKIAEESTYNIIIKKNIKLEEKVEQKKKKKCC